MLIPAIARSQRVKSMYVINITLIQFIDQIFQ